MRKYRIQSGMHSKKLKLFQKDKERRYCRTFVEQHFFTNKKAV